MIRQLLALAVVAGGILAAREQEVPASREQTFFREDELLQRPVTLSRRSEGSVGNQRGKTGIRARKRFSARKPCSVVSCS
jgi:hypothetical protein